MIRPSSPEDIPWKRSRFGFALFFCVSLVALWSLLRITLLMQFGSTGASGVGKVLQLFLIGFSADLLVALLASLPLILWFSVLSDKGFGQVWHRAVLTGGLFVFWTAQVFLCFTEYYFFEEFQSRFNTVAVDYLLYPTEVVGNIWASYPVVIVVCVCTAFGLAWCVLAFRCFRPMWTQSTTRRSRWGHAGATVALCAFLLPTIDLAGARFSRDRVLNQIANNGAISFVAAAWTRNLDYAAHYQTLSRDEAYARARKLLESARAKFIDAQGIRRAMTGDSSRPRLNVVILLEESLGSEFWGCLGRPGPTLMPQMDKLATTEGLLFTNIYASGNRTVRGFEGVFSSFPPLPGDSIVVRDRSENVESIARVLKRDGYHTLFLYGGRGMFDGMRAYALNNGWDRFLEHNPPFQDDFPNPGFATVWGVCDEEVFDRAIQEFRGLASANKPFFGTVLTVSNHKPFTYPTGRIPFDPVKPIPLREKAVYYSDWCLGRFFEQAKKESFWTNTIFVVVADHGARVYGSQNIPIASYEIPFVILGPAVVPAPQRIGTLGNSLDVAPTILGLIGRPYESLFFGRDLLQDPPDAARALLNHNRDIGLFAHDRMAVLSLGKIAEFYQGNPKAGDLTPVQQTGPELIELQKNATALFQVADELYMQRRYRIDASPQGSRTTSAENSKSTIYD